MEGLLAIGIIQFVLVVILYKWIPAFAGMTAFFDLH